MGHELEGSRILATAGTEESDCGARFYLIVVAVAI